MAYEVIKAFSDLKDRKRVYREGDAFPVEGVKVSDERLKELLGAENKHKQPVIKEVEEKVSLEDKTVPELKALADEKELEYDPKIKKADLIELLEK